MGDVAPKETMPKAKDALLKALSLDDSLAQAHTSLGWVLDIFDWDWAGSEREFRRAIELDSSDAVAHHRYAVHLAAMGRFPESLSEMRAAAQLDPLSPVAMAGIGWVYLRGRQPDRALAECQKALDLDPNFARGYMCRGQVYEQKRDFDHAAAEFLQARIVAGEPREIVDPLKAAVAQAGYKGYFRTRLGQLSAKSRQTYVSPYDFADTWDRLGENDQVLKWLEASYADRSPCLANLQIEWRLDGVRTDPRFQDLLRRVGLAQIHIEPLD